MHRKRAICEQYVSDMHAVEQQYLWGTDRPTVTAVEVCPCLAFASIDWAFGVVCIARCELAIGAWQVAKCLCRLACLFTHHCCSPTTLGEMGVEAPAQWPLGHSVLPAADARCMPFE